MGISGIPDLGPTGEFPEGKLDETDKGAIKIAIAADPESKTVLLDFGTPVLWFGMTKAEAINLGNLIKAKARELPD